MTSLTNEETEAQKGQKLGQGLTETMGRVNTRFNLGTGEWHQRMGHAELKLGSSSMACLDPTYPVFPLHCSVCTVGRTLTTGPSVVEAISEPALGLWDPPEHCCLV